MRDQSFARQITQEHFHRSAPVDWFDQLYRKSDGDETRIPWADCRPNPNLLEFNGTGKRALVVGCGLGDDAEQLAAWQFQVTAFDVSPTAIEWARSRFPQSRVSYVTADLFHPPAEWSTAFDFVLESYTVQALPPEYRRTATERLAAFVAPGGQLLLIARGRDENESPGELPWPLTRADVLAFTEFGLELSRLDDYMDAEDPPERRFRALFVRGDK